MAQTVPTLNLRSEAAGPLTAVEHDENWTIIRDFSNALAAQISASLREDGSLLDGSVTLASLADRIINKQKAAFDLNHCYTDQTPNDPNIITINPAPAATAFVEGMLFFIYIPTTKLSNTGPVFLEVNALTGDDNAQVLYPGMVELPTAYLIAGSVMAVQCVAAPSQGQKAKFLVVNQATATGGGSGEGKINNGSFERQQGSLPDGWELVLNARSGGSPTVTMASGANESAHGKWAMQFNLAAGTSQDYHSLYSSVDGLYPCKALEPETFRWLLKILPGQANGADIPVRIRAHWYDFNKAPIQDSDDIYSKIWDKSDTALLTDWTRLYGAALPPQGAHFYRIEISCGWDVAGTDTDHNDAQIFFDDFQKAETVFSTREEYGPDANEYNFQFPDQWHLAYIECHGGGGASTTKDNGGIENGCGGGGATVIAIVPIDPTATYVAKVGFGGASSYGSDGEWNSPLTNGEDTYFTGPGVNLLAGGGKGQRASINDDADGGVASGGLLNINGGKGLSAGGTGDLTDWSQQKLNEVGRNMYLPLVYKNADPSNVLEIEILQPGCGGRYRSISGGVDAIEGGIAGKLVIRRLA